MLLSLLSLLLLLLLLLLPSLCFRCCQSHFGAEFPVTRLPVRIQEMIDDSSLLPPSPHAAFCTDQPHCRASLPSGSSPASSRRAQPSR
jgi:hypothetical protein